MQTTAMSFTVAPATQDRVTDFRVALHDKIRASVAAREPVDDRERASIRRFLDHFDRLEDPLSEAADPVHVTGSGVLVGPRGVLLLKHRRLGIWLQPGGHVDPGETPWVAARRETREETGLDVDFAGPIDDDGMPTLLHVDVHPGGRGHTHLDLRYRFESDADPDPPVGESQQIGWFDWDDALQIADGGLAGLLRSVRSDLQ